MFSLPFLFLGKLHFQNERKRQADTYTDMQRDVQTFIHAKGTDRQKKRHTKIIEGESVTTYIIQENKIGNIF